jgi:hypothetical protein
MDDLVVIILTLLIAGAGAIGQIKKKKQIPVSPGEQKNPNDIWDLFRQEPFNPVIKTEPEYINVEEEESEPYENEQGYQFEAINEGGVLINNDLNANPKPGEVIPNKNERFSLRKAVIYSEILNRKYI